MKTFTVNKSTTLKQFTDDNFPQGSFCLSRLLKRRDVKINGARISGDAPVKAGDKIEYYTTPDEENKPVHSLVYADENIYVADKPSGVSSEGLFSSLCVQGEFYAVHRLDRNTEGLIVYARNKRAEEALLRAFRQGNVDKTYLAVCKNKFTKKSEKLRAYLKKDADKSLVKIFASPRTGAVEIVTEYRVLEERGDAALVEIVLHTGKTHQIRAHMAFIGCPVLGDEKYGDEALNKKYSARRQRLVAKYLKINADGLPQTTFESAFMP